MPAELVWSALYIVHWDVQCALNYKATTLQVVNLQSLKRKPEWSTLIGPDCPDTVLSLAEPYCADAKVYAIT